MTGIELIVGFVLSIVVFKTLHYPFIYCVAIVAGLWMMTRAGGGNIVSSTTSAVRKTFEFFLRLVTGIAVFVAIMMIVDNVIGVAPIRITQGFQVLGTAPWNWKQSHIGLQFLMFVCISFLVAGIAIRSAHGDWKIAASIFGFTAVTIFWMLNFPALGDSMGRTTMLEADKKFAKEGVVAPVVKGVGVLIAGQPEDLKKRGVIGSSWKRSKEYLFGESEPEPTTQPPVTQFPYVPPAPQHPKSGSKYVSKDMPFRVWLKPEFAGIRFKNGKCCNEEHPDLCVIDRPERKENEKTIGEWRDFPEGWYIVTSFDSGMNFRWD